MKLVDFQDDQIQILMKMKIMSERGEKEVRHEHKYYISNMVQFHYLLFILNLINSSVDIDLGNFLSGILAIHVCIHP